MTKTMDDTRSAIKLTSSSACMTPYGIVSAGGLNPAGASIATAYVYWPHAYDSYLDFPSGQVAYFRLDNNVIDSMGAGHDGTITGNPTWVSGQYSTAISLDGNDFVEFANSDSMDFEKNFTWAAWVKTSGAGVIMSVADAGTAAWSQGGKMLYSGNNHLCFDVGWDGYVEGTTTINNGAWHHVAVTVEFETSSTLDTVKLYVDGNLDSNTTVRNVNKYTDAGKVFKMGYAGSGTALSGYLTGQIDDARVFSRALTASEIGRIAMGDHYTAGISRALKGLNNGVFGHRLVWHRGKLYRMGGYTSGTINATTIEIFDFDTNAWTLVNYNDAAYFTDITGAVVTFLQPAYAGICSFGDEIFMFGGRLGTAHQATAWAWNPETRVVRQLGDMPTAKAGLTAVPCGSSIYLIGGANISMAESATSPIYKFTP